MFIQKIGSYEHWFFEDLKKERGNFFYRYSYLGYWEFCINIPFDSYEGVNLKEHRRNDIDYSVEFTINGKLIRANVNFNSNELKYEWTTTRIMWVKVQEGVEVLELKRKEFLDQQNIDKVNIGNE